MSGRNAGREIYPDGLPGRPNRTRDRSRSPFPPPRRDHRDSGRSYRDRDRDSYRSDRRDDYSRHDERRGSGQYEGPRHGRRPLDFDRPSRHRPRDDYYRGSRDDDRRRSRSRPRRSRTPDRRRDEEDRRRDEEDRRRDEKEEEAEKAKIRKRQEATAKWKADKQAKLNAEKAAAAANGQASRPTSSAGPSAAGSPAPPAADSLAPKQKFDPKKIAKKAKSLIPGAKAALGQDILIPVSSKSAASPTANKTSLTSSGIKTASQLQVASKVGGFGLNASGQGPADAVANKAIGLDDEQDEHRILEKLPTFSDQIYEDAPQANTPDSTIEMEEAGTEEEMAALAARRAAAEDEVVDEDNIMADAPAEEEAEPMEEEDIDPLDAFMSNLDAKMPQSDFMSMKKRPEALYGEDVLGEETEIVDDDELAAFARRKKKKEIKTVNHGKIDYEPFKKQFYVEPEELKDMDETDLSNLRFELDGIKVRGKDVPKPLQSWPQMGLSVPALEVIRSLKYEKPTPIQSQAVPTIMAGRDVIAVAKTGSGKTMGFLLPMFRHIKDQRPLTKKDGPIAIVLAPTRELANQIHGECKPFLKALGLRAAVCFGQASLKDNIDKIKLGIEIVVATPGRLIDLATVNNGQLLSFRRVTYLVLDEADRLWDMGFAPQVEALINQIRPDRQFVMFSATFPPSMESLARKVLRKPVEIIVGGRATVAPEIEQVIEVREQSSKFGRLLEILGNAYRDETEDRTLIFVERQEACDELFFALTSRQFACGSIHGGREQSDRSSTIEDFKSGAIPIVVATSVAARGLDVKQLKIVINYDVPNHLEDYIHRAGRTGRAGQTGTCYTFITGEQGRNAPDLCKALKQSGKEVPEDLQKLSNDYFEMVKSGKTKASSRGFGGRGIEKIDAARDAARGILGGKYATDDKEGDDKAATKDKAPEIVIHSLADAKKAESEEPEKVVEEAAHPKIEVHKREKVDTKGMDPLAAAKLAASRLTGRLTKPNALRSGQSVDNRGPDAGDYHATLEINDQPQKARWAVTNRTNVSKILEQTGVSITSKGVYYQPPKEPGPGDLPKLYLLVEGDSEASVMEAMRELYRLLREGALMAMEAEARAPRPAGKYSMI